MHAQITSNHGGDVNAILIQWSHAVGAKISIGRTNSVSIAALFAYGIGFAFDTNDHVFANCPFVKVPTCVDFDAAANLGFFEAIVADPTGADTTLSSLIEDTASGSVNESDAAFDAFKRNISCDLLNICRDRRFRTFLVCIHEQKCSRPFKHTGFDGEITSGDMFEQIVR